MKKIIIILFAIIGISFYLGSQQSVHAESGPVAYWDFSEGNGNTIHDKVGLNDGTVYGATWIEGALYFNGLNNYVKIPDNSKLNPTLAITVSMWIKPSVLGGIALNKEIQYRLIAGDVSSTTPSARVRTTNTNWGAIEGHSALTIDNWQHVSLTYDGSSWKIYYNGQLDTEIADNGEITDPYNSIADGNLYLGHIGPNRGRNDLFFKGLIDDVKIYNRALSANEVTEDSSDRTSIPVCDPPRYSDWSDCSSVGSQTRTIISSWSNTCGNSILQQSCTFIPPVCTSWTYSNWSSCSSGGNQTRDIISSSPDSCIGGSPVLSQSCNYVPACALTDWSCSNWSACSQNGNQLRTCDKISNCQGGVASPATSQSCTYIAPVPSCASFNYSNWSECASDGKQTRNIISKNPYNCEGGELPKTTQSCAYIPPCATDTWSCDAWNSCSLSGVQNRSCRKTFDCSNVETAPPVIDQYCEPPNRPTPQTPPSGTEEISNQEVIIKSTVKLLCPVDTQKASQGSGTIIDSSGTILTNKHVVAGTLGCLIGFIGDFNDEPYFGERHIADILKVSPDQDIAILKIRNPQNKTLPNIDIARGSSSLRLGAKITTYGFPAKFGTKVTYTSGDFSGTDGTYIKTTAILEYGNSGGGAYLKDGTFIGIPSAVVRGELNALGYILSINTINAWLGNSIITYGDTGNNQYSRVSILEDIDLKTLDSLKLFVPDTDAKGNFVNPATNKNTQKITEQPKNNQRHKESTIIESVESSPKIKQKQNSLVSPKNEFIEKQGKESKKENGNNADTEVLEQRRSLVTETVQEIVKIADSNIKIGQQVKVIAQTQVQNQEKLEISMKKIQSRSGLAKFFIGSDYGEIKSSQELLEQNKKQIINLKQLGVQLSKKYDQQQIAEQIKLLEYSNQQIETSLNEAKKRFSLFGWAFRSFAK